MVGQPRRQALPRPAAPLVAGKPRRRRRRRRPVGSAATRGAAPLDDALRRLRLCARPPPPPHPDPDEPCGDAPGVPLPPPPPASRDAVSASAAPPSRTDAIRPPSPLLDSTAPLLPHARLRHCVALALGTPALTVPGTSLRLSSGDGGGGAGCVGGRDRHRWRPRRPWRAARPPRGAVGCRRSGAKARELCPGTFSDPSQSGGRGGGGRGARAAAHVAGGARAPRPRRKRLAAPARPPRPADAGRGRPCRGISAGGRGGGSSSCGGGGGGGACGGGDGIVGICGGGGSTCRVRRQELLLWGLDAARRVRQECRRRLGEIREIRGRLGCGTASAARMQAEIRGD